MLQELQIITGIVSIVMFILLLFIIYLGIKEEKRVKNHKVYK